MDNHKAVHWLVKEGYISPVEAGRTFETLGNFKSVIEHINEQSRQEGYEEFMRDAKREADKARIRLENGGMSILVPESWGKAKQKEIRLATAQEIFKELDVLLGGGFYSEAMAQRGYKLYEKEYQTLKAKYNNR